MPAHRPRRLFATPLVVTLAAALPACGAEAPPVTSNPPGPTDAPSAEATAAAAPTPDPVTSPAVVASAKAKRGESWAIIEVSKGKCAAAHVERDNCPPGASCNPPPPSPYDCPKDVSHFPVTLRQDPDSKKCTLTYTQFHNVTCPPPKICNPPPPSEVTVDAACPK